MALKSPRGKALGNKLVTMASAATGTVPRHLAVVVVVVCLAAGARVVASSEQSKTLGLAGHMYSSF